MSIIHVHSSRRKLLPVTPRSSFLFSSPVQSRTCRLLRFIVISLQRHDDLLGRDAGLLLVKGSLESVEAAADDFGGRRRLELARLEGLGQEILPKGWGRGGPCVSITMAARRRGGIVKDSHVPDGLADVRVLLVDGGGKNWRARSAYPTKPPIWKRKREQQGPKHTTRRSDTGRQVLGGREDSRNLAATELGDDLGDAPLALLCADSCGGGARVSNPTTHTHIHAHMHTMVNGPREREGKG